MPNKRTQSGFTLIELIVTVTLAAILMGIGIPSFMETIRSNRLTSATNDLITAFNLARAEAVKRGKMVTVRRVDNSSFTKVGAGAQWENGYDIFVDDDADGVFDAGETFIRTFPGLPLDYTLRRTSNGPRISFLATGGASSVGSFVICDDWDGNAIPEAKTSRLLTLTTSGRVRNYKDSDDPPDGIPNASNGSNILTCTP